MKAVVVKDAKGLPAALFGSGADRTATEAAIRTANPHLDLANLAPGAVVVVPDGLGVPADAVGPVLDPRRLGEVAAAALGRLSSVVNAGLEADTARATELGKALDARDVRQAAAADPGVAAELDRLSHAIAAQQQQAKGWAEAVLRATAAWQADLATLPQ